MKNPIDGIVGYFSPESGLRRARARKALDVVARYEAAQPSRTRKNPGDNRSGDAVVEMDLATLRGQARHLEQNYDFATGILTTLVNNVVGPHGIGVEFMPKDLSGDIHEELATTMNRAYREWARRPECTGQHSWAKTQRLLARTWFRDGEVLARHLEGAIPGYTHASAVPYSLECFEPDFLPHDWSHPSNRVVQGVQKSAWGQVQGYWLYDEHPGGNHGWKNKLRFHRGDSIEHLKFVSRLHQTRGVSIFASVLDRLNDIKDYESSERVAAKIASMMVGFIQKGDPGLYEAEGDEDEKGNRLFDLQAGGIYDDLQPGETVGTIQSNRPSTLLTPFLETMQRMVAAGTNASFSSIAKNYNGTYSSQRQELVEQFVNYTALSLEFCEEIVEPVVRRWVRMAQLSGAIDIPPEVDVSSLLHVDFITPSMPWINPVHEAQADEILLENMLISPQQSIRRRGRNPHEVLDQTASWNKSVKEKELTTPAKRPTTSDAESDPVTKAALAMLEGLNNEGG